VLSRQHDRPLYILTGEPSGLNIRLAPFINHTDQELALIEALVGAPHRSCSRAAITPARGAPTDPYCGEPFRIQLRIRS